MIWFVTLMTRVLNDFNGTGECGFWRGKSMAFCRGKEVSILNILRKLKIEKISSDTCPV